MYEFARLLQGAQRQWIRRLHRSQRLFNAQTSTGVYRPGLVHASAAEPESALAQRLRGWS